MTRLRKSVLLVATALAVFLLGRLALLLTYPEDFGELGAGEVLLSFLGGLRFDLSAILAFFALPLLLINIPLAFARARWWLALWGGLCYLVLVAFTLVLAGDLSYYDYVHRHVAEELWLLGNDLGFLVEAAVVQYPVVLAATLAFLVLLALVCRAILRRPERPGRGGWFRLAFVAVALVIGIRGSLSGKPLTSIDAFRGRSYAAGNLALNGVYTSLRSHIRDEAVMEGIPLSADESCRVLGLDPDAPYPAARSFPGRTPSGRNVVLVLMESWDTRYNDAYQDPPSGVTPNFRELAARGRLFTNFYSASQRSIGALQASLLGMPCVPGLPELGYGLELSNVTRIGRIATAHGYRSILVQAPNRRSFYVDSVASSLGFEEYYGKEDIPDLLDYGGEDARFGWDHETYQFTLGRLNRMEGPFLAVVFTGTIHTPYPDPGARFHLRPHERKGEDGYLNCLHYSDWALGEFLREASKQPWYADTVFLLCADHPWRTSSNPDLRESFRIPFLLLGKGIEPGVDDVVAGQVDLLPTIMDLLGFPDSHSALGESLLAGRDGDVMVMKDAVVGMIGREGFVQHSLRERLSAMAFVPDPPPSWAESLERRLLATCRATYELVSANRWAE